MLLSPVWVHNLEICCTGFFFCKNCKIKHYREPVVSSMDHTWETWHTHHLLVHSVDEAASRKYDSDSWAIFFIWWSIDSVFWPAIETEPRTSTGGSGKSIATALQLDAAYVDRGLGLGLSVSLRLVLSIANNLVQNGIVLHMVGIKPPSRPSKRAGNSSLAYFTQVGSDRM